MCYASPGPRCYSHASVAATNAKEKADALFQSIQDARSEVDLVSSLIEKETDDRQIDSLLESRKQLTQKTEKAVEAHKAACAKWAQAEKDAEATLGGIANLYKTVKEHENSAKPDYKVIAETTMRLNNAKRYFQKKLSKYDEVYGTVNGKKPSRWASDYGMEHLNQQIDKYQKRRATLERNDPKYLAATKKVKSLMEQKAHAVDTLRVIQKDRVGLQNYDEFQKSLHRPPGYAGVDEQLIQRVKSLDNRGRISARTQEIADALAAKREAYEKVLGQLKIQSDNAPAARRVRKQQVAYNQAKLEEVKKFEAKYAAQLRSKRQKLLTSL
jgi:chromosome segregation ATPase